MKNICEDELQKLINKWKYNLVISRDDIYHTACERIIKDLEELKTVAVPISKTENMSLPPEDNNTYQTQTGALISAHDYQFLSDSQKQQCKIYNPISKPKSVKEGERRKEDMENRLVDFAKWFNLNQWVGGKGDKQKALFVACKYPEIVDLYLNKTTLNMNRIAKQDFTLPRHGDLMHKINEFIIAVKLHHTIDPNKEDPESLAKARGNTMQPTWLDVENLLTEIRDELKNEQIDPVKRR